MPRGKLQGVGIVRFNFLNGRRHHSILYILFRLIKYLLIKRVKLKLKDKTLYPCAGFVQRFDELEDLLGFILLKSNNTFMFYFILLISYDSSTYKR